MFKKLPLAVAISALCSFSAASNAADDEQVKEIEKIQVTGSRIKGVDLEGAQPLTVLSQEDIKRSGASSVFELLSDIGQLRGGSGTFSTSESGSTSNSTPAGQAAASLRGMGPSATLTLINGRRVAPSAFAAGTENFVDVNAIPLAAIERIEILATGASAIYGADAVAGVINYILKDDYQGGELDVSYSDSAASSDESKKQINFIYGTEVAGGNLTWFADFYERDDFKASDRDYTSQPLLASGYSYLPKLENTPNIYYYSARSGNELHISDDYYFGDIAGDAGCKTELVVTEYGEYICAYYGNGDDYLQTPFESLSTGLIYNKQFDDITWKTDFFISRTKSTAYSSPAPINQIDDSEGPYVLEDALFIYDQEDGSNPVLDALYIDPFYTINDRRVWGFAFDARFNDPRTVEVETTNWRLVSSLEGTVGDWDWQSGVTLSRSESEQTAIAGIYNRYKVHAALTGELCSDGSIANYDGSDLSCAGGQLLSFYNPFLVGDASNDAKLALAQATPTRNGESSVYAWDAQFNGELFEFNGNLVLASIGIEARYEELSDVPSLDSQARADNDYLVDVFGFGSSLAKADRTQYAAFIEAYAPITDDLELQVAGRYDYFDDFGSTFNPKLGLTYRPIDSIALRASWSTSFRAPSLTQAGVKLRTTQSTFDCGANQAVADLYCEGDGVERTVNTLELGNSKLNAEESEAVSVGFAWSPTQNTNLTIDYWQFDHKEIIDTNMTAVLDRAMTDASLRHCGLVPDGQQGISYTDAVCSVTDESGRYIDEDGANLSQILDAYIAEYDPRYYELELYRDHVILLENTGTQTIAGVDLKFDHRLEFEPGDVVFKLDWTHYIEYDRNKPGSDQKEALIGTYRYPENVARLSTSWRADTYYVTLGASYTDEYADDISGLRGREFDELEQLGLLDIDGNHQVESWLIWDLSVGYDISSQATVRFNIDNLTDEQPPVIYGSSRGFDSINHDAYGTMYRLGLTYKF